jgi:hypothetical protein
MDDETIIEVSNRSRTMAEAAAELGLHFNTFKRRAKRLGCYNTNQGSKGISRYRTPDIKLEDILEGKHPQYQTFKLKNRLFKEGLKINQCEECGISEWNGKPLKCELDHVNGDRTDHRLKNLKIVCPNCHSQTETFRAKNIGRVAKWETQGT